MRRRSRHSANYRRATKIGDATPSAPEAIAITDALRADARAFLEKDAAVRAFDPRQTSKIDILHIRIEWNALARRIANAVAPALAATEATATGWSEYELAALDDAIAALREAIKSANTIEWRGHCENRRNALIRIRSAGKPATATSADTRRLDALAQRMFEKSNTAGLDDECGVALGIFCGPNEVYGTIDHVVYGEPQCTAGDALRSALDVLSSENAEPPATGGANA